MHKEPRFRFTYAPGGLADRRHTFNAAFGLYHQQSIGLTDDRVSSDVFTAWSASPPNEAVPESIHFMAGYATEPGPGLRIRVDAYAKRLRNLGFPALGEPLRGGTRFLLARGFARGVETEFGVARAIGQLTVSYTLASVAYTAAGTRFRPPHDRRHQINALGALNLSRGVRLRAQWQFGSGVPFTRMVGFFDALSLSPNDRSYLTADGNRTIIFAESFDGRLPAYHRLDATLEYDIETPRVALTMSAGAINTYGRANWFDFDYQSLQRVDQLPLVPILGLRVAIP